MGLEDITKQAQEFLGDDKVKKAMQSEQAEDISDKLLDRAADVANKGTAASSSNGSAAPGTPQINSSATSNARRVAPQASGDSYLSGRDCRLRLYLSTGKVTVGPRPRSAVRVRWDSSTRAPRHPLPTDWTEAPASRPPSTPSWAHGYQVRSKLKAHIRPRCRAHRARRPAAPSG